MNGTQHKMRYPVQPLSKDGSFALHKITPRVHVLVDALQRHGWPYMVYVGCRNKPEAEKLWTPSRYREQNWLLLNRKCSQVNIRKPERLSTKGIRWELKIAGLDEATLQQMIQRDITPQAA